MSSTTTEHPRHAITRAVAAAHALLDEVATAPVWSLDQAETAQTLTELTRLVARVQGLEVAVAGHAVEVKVEDPTGATSTANWWSHATRMTRGEAHGKVKLAQSLSAPVATALAAGEVLLDQARVITRAVEELPEDLDVDLVARSEAYLLAQASELDAKQLRILGRGILAHLAPDIADAHEAKLLEDEERAALAATRFTMNSDGHGKVYGRFTIPEAQAAMLKKALYGLAAPEHLAATEGKATLRPSAEKLGRAFCEYVERYPAEKLPNAGGLNATIVVTMDVETLMDGLGAATLDTGERISPSQARRMACEAGLVPTVLNSKSQLLDLGRKTRFHTGVQRIALGLTQRGCMARGCDAPPGLCHVHHVMRYADGGRTTVEEGKLLCARHHVHIHDPHYEVTHRPDGTISFHRRI